MPIKTDLSVSPYFADFDESKKYHKVLFKPTVAVQAREVNNLQNIIQNQIEIFGNNIFKKGTVIDGCNFIFYDNVPYVKIKDSLVSGDTALPSEYLGYFVRNSTNLKAKIINYYDGFETADPDLKTLYLSYINSGNSFSETTFTPGEILTVFDSDNSIHSVNVSSSGTGYSNSDSIVFTPQLVVNVTSGSFEIGDQITDPATGANGLITSIETLVERRPVVKLPGTLSVETNNTDIVGTSTTFTTNFSNGDYVALYSNSSTYSIHKINVVTSNTVMNVTSNVTFTNTAADYSNTTNSEVFLQYSPLAGDLANSTSTSNNWTFTTGNTIQGSTSSDIAKVIGKVGQNATATLVTDATGSISSVTMTNRGTGYSKTPYASIKSISGTSVDLDAKNFIGQVTISSVSDSIGSGYMFGVTRGHIFQKGHFIRVDPQTIVVEKYSRSPNNVSVAFETNEEIINSNIDTNLVDNALGAPNYTAPGADRLKLSANLVTFETSNSIIDGNEFVLVEWSDGVPYKQNRLTEYNTIQESISRQIYETDGNYVVDRFLITSTSPSNTSLEGNTYNIVVDPGTAYVQGKRLQTLGNYVYSGSKISANTITYENSKLSLNYENYVRINELGGFFEFDQANEVSLYDTAKNFLSTSGLITTGNTEPVGTQIGSARIRNFVYEQGTPGSPNCIYRLYLFDIKMNSGKNFKNVRSVHFDSGTNDGIADTYLENDPTTNTNIAVLYNKNDKLVFNTNYNSIKNSNNINYTYRTVETTSISNTGQLSKSLVPISKTFPYTGTLTDAQKLELYVAPKANLVAFDSLSGTVDISDSNTDVTGSGTAFLSEIKVGDYLQFSDSSDNDIKRVTSITNNTLLEVDSFPSFGNTGATAYKAWPMNVPIQLAYNTNYNANVNETSEVLTIDLLSGTSNGFNTASNTDVYFAYNVEVNNASATSKTPVRNVYVKIRCSNNTSTNVGPWCLGITDIFRLKGVWKSTSSNVSESNTDVTSEFYVDHNQTSNYYDLGYLYQRPGSGLKLTEDDYLLVKIDRLDASAGFYMATSYVSSNTTTRVTEDSKPLANLSSTMNTLEIPEFVDEKGNYFDLINCIDFRPRVSDTANGNATSISSATINPANTFTFSATDRYFPVPDSIFTYDIEDYNLRYDVVSVDRTGKININQSASLNGINKNITQNEILLDILKVPPYPSVPFNKSSQLVSILDKKLYNENKVNRRTQRNQIENVLTEFDVDVNQPKNYTHGDVSKIDRRVRALEYYVSFNYLQSQVKNLVIPSSISSTINRFKYGFFVDDYNYDKYSEYKSPEYFAQLVDGKVEPLSLNLNVVHANNNPASVDYTEVEIINQPLATIDVDDHCSCNTTTTSSNATLYKLYAKQENKIRYTESSPYEEPARYITMGTSSSNATIWFHAYGAKDKIFIYQGNTLFLTGDDAVSLTSDEVSALKEDSFFNGSPDGYEIAVSTNGSAPGDNYIENTGKISWTHNPSLGRTYKIVVHKSSATWRYRADFYNAAGGDVCFCDPTDPPPSLFDGVMTIEPPVFDGVDVRTSNDSRRDWGDDAGKSGPGGDAAGTSGGGGGAGGSGKVVCTAMNDLYGFGSFRNAIWLKYSEQNLSKEYEVGYHTIFLPLVDYAYKTNNIGHLKLRKTLEWIAKHRTKDLWHEMKNTGKRDFWGRIIRPPLENLCYLVGSLKIKRNKE